MDCRDCHRPRATTGDQTHDLARGTTVYRFARMFFTTETNPKSKIQNPKSQLPVLGHLDMNQSTASAPASHDEVLAILNRAFADRHHSWAEYILEAGSYIREEDAPLRGAIEQIAASDRAAAERLTGVIEGLEGIPQAPPYAHQVAELNYLSLDFLRNALRDELSRQVKDYDRQLPLLEHCAAARNVLYSITQTLRAQIAQLA